MSTTSSGSTLTVSSGNSLLSPDNHGSSQNLIDSSDSSNSRQHGISRKGGSKSPQLESNVSSSSLLAERKLGAGVEALFDSPIGGSRRGLADSPALAASSLLADAASMSNKAAGQLNPGVTLTGAASGVPNSGSVSAEASEQRTSRLRVYYCRACCLMLWIQMIRLIVGLATDESPLTLDLRHLGSYKLRFLIPALCVAIQAAVVSLIFIRNCDESNWLVPFYSNKDYLIRSRSNFRPKMRDHQRRVNVSLILTCIFATICSCSFVLYLAHGNYESLSFKALISPSSLSEKEWQTVRSMKYLKFEAFGVLALVILDAIWAVYSTFTCFLVCFYFNLICSIMKQRFHTISKIIEDLAESDTTKTTNQARKITTLYLEHNEACELVDESNDFWQYLIFFTYFTYIPAYCYCLYNLFFVDFESWTSFITWVMHNQTGFIILLVSFSAAGVSTEVSSSYLFVVSCGYHVIAKQSSCCSCCCRRYIFSLLQNHQEFKSLNQVVTWRPQVSGNLFD